MPLIEDLKRHEGFRSKPYKDSVGVLTVGYGLNLEAGITEEEAAIILEIRVKKIQSELSKSLPFFSQIYKRRQDVLTNMAYNLGVDGLLKFKNTLGHIERGEYQQAADAMLKSKWARQVGERAVELAEMMKLG